MDLVKWLLATVESTGVVVLASQRVTEASFDLNIDLTSTAIRIRVVLKGAWRDE